MGFGFSCEPATVQHWFPPFLSQTVLVEDLTQRLFGEERYQATSYEYGPSDSIQLEIGT